MNGQSVRVSANKGVGQFGSVILCILAAALTGCRGGSHAVGVAVKSTRRWFFVAIGAAALICGRPGLRLAAAQALINLHSFNYSDGFYPTAGLMQATDGYLYGTTLLGGANTYGEIFQP